MLTLALPATAVAGVFSAPGAGARLGAGGQVEVRWEGLPQGIEEMELLLSCDGGHRFARVADRLDPSAVSYAWVVPSLPTDDAVLAIRGRVDGRETLLLATGTFSIEPTPGLGLHPLSYHADELWTDTAGRPTPGNGPGLADPPTRASVALPAVDEPDESSSHLDRVAPALSSDEPAAPAGCSAPAPEPSRSRSPLSFPQRK